MGFTVRSTALLDAVEANLANSSTCWFRRPPHLPLGCPVPCVRPCPGRDSSPSPSRHLLQLAIVDSTHIDHLERGRPLFGLGLLRSGPAGSPTPGFPPGCPSFHIAAVPNNPHDEYRHNPDELVPGCVPAAEGRRPQFSRFKGRSFPGCAKAGLPDSPLGQDRGPLRFDRHGLCGISTCPRRRSAAPG